MLPAWHCGTKIAFGCEVDGGVGGGGGGGGGADVPNRLFMKGI